MSDPRTILADKLQSKQVRCSYNYCGICGHIQKSNMEEPNYAVLRWWDPDDGWKLGTLCIWCYLDTFDRKPKPGDYAFERTNHVADDVNTDEDPIHAIS